MENKLKKYYLGTLTETEIEEIDLRLMTDETFEEDLLLAKNNLMEDYLDDSLSVDEIESFERNFLKNEERKKELKNLALLKGYARQKMTEKSAIEKHEKGSVGAFDRLNKFFSLNFRALAVSFAAVVLVAVLLGFYFFKAGVNELAQLNQQDFTNVDQYRNLTNLNLISGTFRNTARTVNLSADKLTDPVFLRLALPLEGEFFDVNIIRNEEKIASNLRTRSYSNQNGRELRLLVPVSDLTEGDYKIQVFPADSQTAPAVYSFTVQ